MAWPMWREPVTLGGGIGITKGLPPPWSKLGLKYPCDSHLNTHESSELTHKTKPSTFLTSKLRKLQINQQKVFYHLYIFSSEAKSKLLDVSGEVKTSLPEAAATEEKKMKKKKMNSN